jgi:hypothetical protein
VIETIFDEDESVVQVFVTVTVVERIEPEDPAKRVTQISRTDAATKGIEAEVGDELLFQLYFGPGNGDEALVQDERYGDILRLDASIIDFVRIAGLTEVAIPCDAAFGCGAPELPSRLCWDHERGELTERFPSGDEAWQTRLEHINLYTRQRAAFLRSMSPEERAVEMARVASNRETRLRNEEETKKAEEAEQIARDESDRTTHSYLAAGIVGTLTEVGRPYGLSAVAVGRILTSHDLRRVVEVEVAGSNGRSHLNLVRAIPEGYAVHEYSTGRDYWIVARVAPLLCGASQKRTTPARETRTSSGS